jgi:hypothetical protein
MKLPGDTGFASDAELEVELSAQDLIGLTPIQGKPAQPTLQLISSDGPRVTSAATAAVATASPIPGAVRIPPRMFSPRVMGAVAASIVAVLAAGILFESAPPQRVVERPVSNWSPVPDPVVNEVSEVEEAPTLIANPFDRTEVFELPAGISQEEAKAMVADLLLKRASERQVYSSNRR